MTHANDCGTACRIQKRKELCGKAAASPGAARAVGRAVGRRYRNGWLSRVRAFEWPNYWLTCTAKVSVGFAVQELEVSW